MLLLFLHAVRGGLLFNRSQCGKHISLSISYFFVRSDGNFGVFQFFWFLYVCVCLGR